MFDDFLRARAERDGTPFVPFDVKADYDPYVDGKPRLDGTRDFLASRGIDAARGRAGRPAGRRDASTAWRPARTTSCRRRSARDGVRRLPRLGALPAGRAGRGPAHRACVSSSAQRRGRCCEVAGLARPASTTGSTGWSPSSAACPASPRPTRSSPRAADLGVPNREQAVVFEDALAGVEAGPRGRLRLRGRRRPRRAGRRAARARRRRRRRRPGRALLDAATVANAPTGEDAMSPDPGRPFTVEPWHVREPQLDLDALGQTESVFALSNGHIGLRGNLDEGEPHGTARHLPQLVLRAAAAARTPRRATATPSPARRSSTSPTAS